MLDRNKTLQQYAVIRLLKQSYIAYNIDPSNYLLLLQFSNTTSDILIRTPLGKPIWIPIACVSTVNCTNPDSPNYKYALIKLGHIAIRECKWDANFKKLYDSIIGVRRAEVKEVASVIMKQQEVTPTDTQVIISLLLDIKSILSDISKKLD
jgi:hypothetical protein